jgi:hypothetical protein
MRAVPCPMVNTLTVYDSTAARQAMYATCQSTAEQDVRPTESAARLQAASNVGLGGDSQARTGGALESYRASRIHEILR